VNLGINQSNGGGGWTSIVDYEQAGRRGVQGSIVFRTQRGCLLNCVSCVFNRGHWSSVNLRINRSNGGRDWMFVTESGLARRRGVLGTIESRTHHSCPHAICNVVCHPGHLAYDLPDVLELRLRTWRRSPRGQLPREPSEPIMPQVVLYFLWGSPPLSRGASGSQFHHLRRQLAIVF